MSLNKIIPQLPDAFCRSQLQTPELLTEGLLWSLTLQMILSPPSEAVLQFRSLPFPSLSFSPFPFFPSFLSVLGIEPRPFILSYISNFFFYFLFSLNC